MAIKKYKPTTNGRRNMTTLANDRITKSTPEKSLLAPKKSKGGRGNTGRITTRHQGGGVKQKYRIIDFKRNKDGITGVVAAIEYDPNRNANIALINYVDGEKRYIIAPQQLEVGNKIVSGEAADIKVGNAMELRNIPEGTFVHCVELVPGKGGQMAAHKSSVSMVRTQHCVCPPAKSARSATTAAQRSVLSATKTTP